MGEVPRAAPAWGDKEGVREGWGDRWDRRKMRGGQGDRGKEEP